jgi:hypothetical protein
MPKMKIFNSLEKEAFDSPPMFNSAERKQFFCLPLLIKDSITDLRTSTNKVCFLVVVARQLGRKGGRKRLMTESKIKSAKKLLANGVPPRDVANNLGVSIPTLYRWIPAAAHISHILNDVSE